jgi:hypothetical protein
MLCFYIREEDRINACFSLKNTVIITNKYQIIIIYNNSFHFCSIVVCLAVFENISILFNVKMNQRFLLC